MHPPLIESHVLLSVHLSLASELACLSRYSSLYSARVCRLDLLRVAGDFSLMASAGARVRRIRLHLTVCALIVLSSGAATCVLASAPQNHQSVPHDGVCGAAGLVAGDFCFPVVDYPIASTLLKASAIVSPRHNKEHQKLVDQNEVSLLSHKASKDFDHLLAHHLDASARRDSSLSDPSYEPTLVDGRHSRCEEVLRKYVCQLQFPRCFDDPAYVDAGKAIHLQPCYSLCHEVRSVCNLAHRIDCRHHHQQLNHAWVTPTEHQLKFEGRYQNSDPYAEFWRIDCIDQPPSSWKYLLHYLLYDGPGSIALYTVCALLLYGVMSKLLGLSVDSDVAAVSRLRDERMARRVQFEANLRKKRKKYVRMQEIKTIMIEQQAEEEEQLRALSATRSPVDAAAAGDVTSVSMNASPSSDIHSLASSIRTRRAKLFELDTLLSDLEVSISEEFRRMRRQLQRDAKENVELGFGGVEGAKRLAAAEAELDETQIIDTPTMLASDDGDDGTDEESEKLFGRRRRHVSRTRQRAVERRESTEESESGADDAHHRDDEEDQEAPFANTTQQRRR